MSNCGVKLCHFGFSDTGAIFQGYMRKRFDTARYQVVRPIWAVFGVKHVFRCFDPDITLIIRIVTASVSECQIILKTSSENLKKKKRILPDPKISEKF